MPAPALFTFGDLAAAFGLGNVRRFQQPAKEPPAELGRFDIKDPEQAPPTPLRESLIGTVIETELRIFSATYTDYDAQGRQTTVTTPEVALDAAFITFQQSNEIVRSAPVFWNGSVKEMIQVGDWQLSVRGAIWHPTNMDTYPEEAVRDWLTVLGAKVALPVGGYFVELFGITHIVIESKNWPECIHSNMQLLEFSALSDTPAEMLLGWDADAQTTALTAS